MGADAKSRLLFWFSRHFEYLVHGKLHGNICILSNLFTVHSQVVDRIRQCKLTVVYSDVLPIVSNGLDSDQRDYVVSLSLFRQFSH